MPTKSYRNSFFLVFLIALTIPSVWSDCLAVDEACFHCGMLKSRFSHSWVIIEYEEGRRTGVCSIHCAAIDMVINKDALIRSITAADFTTNEQIDAYRAYWVIGGDLKGVMTSNAKWAFKEKSTAETFIKQHGGKLSVFEEAIRTAFSDLYEDTIAFKRKLMMQELEQNGDLK